jgi:hypothetical protein
MQDFEKMLYIESVGHAGRHNFEKLSTTDPVEQASHSTFFEASLNLHEVQFVGHF